MNIFGYFKVLLLIHCWIRSFIFQKYRCSCDHIKRYINWNEVLSIYLFIKDSFAQICVLKNDNYFRI